MLGNTSIKPTSRNLIFPVTLGDTNQFIDEIFKNLNDNFFNKNKIVPNYPPMDIYQDESNFFIDVVVSGFEKDEIKINIKNKNLSIKAEKNNNSKNNLEDNKESENDNKYYVLKNISKKNFERNFEFLKNIENVEANMNNGILSIKVIFEEQNDNSKIIEIQ